MLPNYAFVIFARFRICLFLGTRASAPIYGRTSTRLATERITKEKTFQARLTHEYTRVTNILENAKLLVPAFDGSELFLDRDDCANNNAVSRKDPGILFDPVDSRSIYLKRGIALRHTIPPSLMTSLYSI